KKVGDKVQRDEPLFEISTDKVDAEIPAPTSGVLREIKVKEGATVQVNSVVAVIGGSGAQGPAAAAPQKAAAPAKPALVLVAPQAQPQQHEVIGFPAQERGGFPGGNGGQAAENVRSSPLVRRIARENNVDLSRVPGTGLGGRISKQDIQNFIQQHGAGQAGGAPQAVAAPSQPRPTPAQAAAPAPRPATPPQLQVVPGELVPMSPMRKKIAERMVESKRTSAHVHSIFKVDMTRIARFREANRKAWEARNGVKLTYMPFIAKAM